MRPKHVGILSIIALLAFFLWGCSQSTLLNLGFEQGDFTGWENETKCFTITDAITFSTNRYYMQEGTYHAISSMEGTGTLTSTPILLSQTGYLSFLLSAAATEDTYVRILDAKNKEEIIRVHNDFYDAPDYTNSYLRVNLDLSEFLGSKIILQVVDSSTTDSINVDDFFVLDWIITTIC
jgi:hypothetical protein